MTTKIVLLKHGLKIGEQTFKKITIREPVLGDLLNAEKVASPANPIAFAARSLSSASTPWMARRCR